MVFIKIRDICARELVSYTAIVHVPGVDSALRKEYQDIPGAKGGQCVGLTTLPSSCADCIEIREP
jgi:hypothetical protein